MDGSGDASATWSWTENLAGVIPPLITPLDHAGHVDTAGVDALVTYTLAAGCSGLFVAGGCGLGPWLPSDAEEQRRITAILRRHGLLEAAALGTV